MAEPSQDLGPESSYSCFHTQEHSEEVGCCDCIVALTFRKLHGVNEFATCCINSQALTEYLAPITFCFCTSSLLASISKAFKMLINRQEHKAVR